MNGVQLDSVLLRIWNRALHGIALRVRQHECTESLLKRFGRLMLGLKGFDRNVFDTDPPAQVLFEDAYNVQQR